MAAERIAAYHEKQLTETWISKDEPDVQLGQMVRPLDKVEAFLHVDELATQESLSTYDFVHSRTHDGRPLRRSRYRPN